MKGDKAIIDKLNYLLEGELTAINQYMLHAETCEDWGYAKLSGDFKTRAIKEMHHAEHLMERILFLEGKPIVSKLSEFNIGKTVPEQVDNDHDMELQTVIEGILADEDAHVDELEALQDQIDQMGLQIFLSTQKPEE